jgi:hypothetical protein
MTLPVYSRTGARGGGSSAQLTPQQIVEGANSITGYRDIREIGNSPAMSDVNDMIADSSFISGTVLRIPPGYTLPADEAMTNSGKSLHIRASGSTILRTNAGAIVDLKNTFESRYIVSAIAPVTINNQVGSPLVTSQLTLNATPPWKAGDLVKIISDDLIPNRRPATSSSTNPYTLTLNGATSITISVIGPTGGTQTAVLAGANTMTAATLQAALQGLSNVGAGNATVVTGGAGGPYTLYFAASLGTMILGVAAYTGGTGPTASIPDSRQGQFATVFSVSGSTVILSTPLRLTYTTGISIARLPFVTSTWEGGSVAYDSSLFGVAANNMMNWTALVQPTVRDLYVPGATAAVLRFNSCYGYLVDNQRTQFAVDLPPTYVGYGVFDAGSEFGQFRNSLLGYVRHAFTDDTSRRAIGDTDFVNHGGSYAASVTNVNVIGCGSTSFAPHQNGEGHTFTACRSYGGLTFGFAVRGANHRYVDCASDNDAQGAYQSITDDDGGFTYGHRIERMWVRSQLVGQPVIKVVNNGVPAGASYGVRENRTVLTIDGGHFDGGESLLQAINSTVNIKNDPVWLAPPTLANGTAAIILQNSVLKSKDCTLDYSNNTAGTSLVAVSADSTSVVRMEKEMRIVNATATNTGIDARMLNYVLTPSGTAASSGHLIQLVLDVFGATNGAETPTNNLTCSFRWRYVDDSLSSKYMGRTATNIGNATYVGRLTSTMDEEITIRCDLTADGNEYVLPVLPNGHHRGQRLNIRVGAPVTTASLRIRAGNAYGTRFPGGDIVLWHAETITLVWTGDYWFCLNVNQLRTNNGTKTPTTKWQLSGVPTSTPWTTVASGTGFWVPLDIPSDQAYAAIGVGVGTQFTTGSGASAHFGLYADDGTGNSPALTVLADAGSYDLTTAASTLALGTFTWPRIRPGRVWLHMLYTFTTAPAAGSLYNLTGPVILLAGGGIVSAYRGYYMTGIAGTALPTAGTLNIGAAVSGATPIPALGLRAA